MGKELLKQLITLLASFLFSWLIGKYPTFPLDDKTFVNLIIWIFASMGIINGLRYQYAKIYAGFRDYKMRHNYK